MLKLTVAVLALTLVGGASAEEWRIDAGSHRAFKQSLEAAKDELSPENLQLLGGALKHIWDQGTKAAGTQQRRYSDKDYFRQLDGLSYEEIVHFTDATYEAALREQQYRAALDGTERATPESKYSAARATMPPFRYRHPPDPSQFPRMPNSDYVPHGGTDLYGVPGQQ